MPFARGIAGAHAARGGLQDPVLRRDGLASDRLGDAMAFFELSNRQAHRLFCDCHYSGNMTGAGLAARLRRLAQGGIRTWFA